MICQMSMMIKFQVRKGSLRRSLMKTICYFAQILSLLVCLITAVEIWQIQNNTKHEKEVDLNKINNTSEDVKEEYSEDDSFEKIGFQLKLKTLCPKENNSDVILDQNELHMISNITMNHNSDSSSILRWGRNEDIKTFKTLREL